MPDYFAQHSGALNLRAQTSTPNRGFRPGQLGALHAVLAHASVHDDPAIVCLPTPITGIRRRLVDAHLADLMAFGINYARQGGAARAYWLVSE